MTRFEELQQAIIDGKAPVAKELTDKMLKEGIRPGDVITKVDDSKVTSSMEITRVLRGLKSKKTFGVTVVRNHKEMPLTVTMESTGSSVRAAANLLWCEFADSPRDGYERANAPFDRAASAVAVIPGPTPVSKAATITVYSGPGHDSSLQVPLMNACKPGECF